MLVYGVFVSGFQVGEYEGYRARLRLEQVVTKVKTKRRRKNPCICTQRQLTCYKIGPLIFQET